MKKILLYYPKISGDTDSKTLYQGLPLSVLTLASQFDSSEFELKIIDGRLQDYTNEGLDEWLDDNVACVGISAITSYQIKNGLDFAKSIRNCMYDIPIVWGGWHPSLMPEQTIQHSLVDIVVMGQGESTFTALAKQLANNGSLEKIPNILYKDKGETVKTELLPYFDFSSSEKIEKAYSYINVEDYIQTLWGNKKVVGYETSRGCPWRCKFCSIGSVYKGRWNALSPDRIVEGISYLVDNHNIDAVHFFDNNLFVNTDRAMKISEKLIENKINIQWDGTAVVEQILDFTDEYIESLKKSGFYRIIIGIESGDEEVLEKINKKHNNEQVIRLVEKCHKHGIQASLSFMVGFPWNPEKDVEKTIELIEKIKAIAPTTEILLFIFSPYIGTPLFDVALEYNMQFPTTLEGWANHTYEKVNVPWISDKLKRKINRYISFFGTKDMSDKARTFFRGGKSIDGVEK